MKTDLRLQIVTEFCENCGWILDGFPGNRGFCCRCATQAPGATPAGNLAISSVRFSGFLAVVSCFLLDCFGSGSVIEPVRSLLPVVGRTTRCCRHHSDHCLSCSWMRCQSRANGRFANATASETGDAGDCNALSAVATQAAWDSQTFRAGGEVASRS